jgi:hypothetical protein
VTIWVINCDVDPGNVTVADVINSNIPDEFGCVLPSGVRFSVTQNGVPLGGAGFPFVSVNGQFTVNLLVGSTVVITEDTTSTGGTGAVAVFQVTSDLYQPRQNPITIQPVTADQTDVLFVNVLQAGPSPSASPSPAPSGSPGPNPPGPGGNPGPAASPSASATPETITMFPGTGIGGAIQSAGGMTVMVLLALAALSAGYVGVRRRKARDL